MTFSEIPDISLTAVGFPDNSKFSRQEVTLHYTTYCSNFVKQTQKSKTVSSHETTSNLRRMSFELPFELQFHWCYIKELNKRLITTSHQQPTISSKAAAVRILSEMTECF